MPRFYADLDLRADTELALPAGTARHVQVLRLQPGKPITLFNGQGGEWQARIVRMGRQDVVVQLESHDSVERELATAVTLAVGMPANDRFDWLVEKATELGARTIQPLMCERSVLRLTGERAAKKREHWQGVAVAAAEQCGRTRVPQIAPVRTLADWLQAGAGSGSSSDPRWVLSLREARPLRERLADPAAAAAPAALTVLSGPEGGLSPAEEDAALKCGFLPVSLGSRTLRAETAPLVILSALGLPG
ncbi:MAG: 16S rRNA (uracil(1498)-N(3))-methyltransferase [Leptothrix sp. (in: b-proteobacteria)]